jgi:hypothetical protein
MNIGNYVQKFWRYLSVAATVAILLGAGVFVFESLPPRTIVMATGAEGGANYELGIRYREILAREGVELQPLFARAEGGRTAAAEDMLQFAHRYIEKYGPIFEQHERQGLDPPEIYPHPDDFIIDDSTGEVTIDGPTSKEEAGARKALVQKAIDTMLRYFEVERALKEDPKNSALRQEFKQLKLYHDVFLEDGKRKHKARGAATIPACT